MKTSKSFLQKLFSFMILSLFAGSGLFCASSSSWVIAAQKFDFARGQKTDSLSSAACEMIPSSILEKISRNLERNVLPDERFEREKYSLKTQRQSLFLQLSNEYQKRDLIFLNDYSEKQLKSKLREENLAIKEIEEKIDQNLLSLKESEEETQRQMNSISQEMLDENENKSEAEVFKSFFKKLFVKEENIITSEDISLYQNDFTRLFKPSESAQKAGYQSPLFEKEINSAKINTLITGTITAYGDYISVNIEIYLYPGCKKLGSLMEVGSLQDIELITTSLAGQMLPLLTNAFPVNLKILMNPPEAAQNASFYIDGLLQTGNKEEIILESGSHTIEFLSAGYKTISTTYYFEGNSHYNIEINFEKRTDGYIRLATKELLNGTFYANSQLAPNFSDNEALIKINGNSILGQFISEDGKSAFYYVPQKLIFDGSYVKINPKVRDREAYIDNRRRWFYASYTMFMVSMIPTFYTYGNLLNQAQLYSDGNITYDDAIKWQKANNICKGISIGCGVFMAYELVRYFLAANSVLPQKTKAGKLSDFTSQQVEQTSQ